MSGFWDAVEQIDDGTPPDAGTGPRCPAGGRRCPSWLCDCFVNECDGCASGTCPTGGLHPELFAVGRIEGAP